MVTQCGSKSYLKASFVQELHIDTVTCVWIPHVIRVVMKDNEIPVAYHMKSMCFISLCFCHSSWCNHCSCCHIAFLPHSWHSLKHQHVFSKFLIVPIMYYKPPWHLTEEVLYIYMYIHILSIVKNTILVIFLLPFHIVFWQSFWPFLTCWSLLENQFPYWK